MDLNHLRELLDLVREHELSEFEIEHEGLKLKVRKNGVAPMVGAAANGGGDAMRAPVAGLPSAAPASGAAPAVASPAPLNGADEAADAEIELAVVKSPIVGTFYRSPEPGAASFVEVGSAVKKGQVLCIIEATKLMNEIESETDGEIAAVYVENGKAVQFGERLFAIKVS